MRARCGATKDQNRPVCSSRSVPRERISALSQARQGIGRTRAALCCDVHFASAGQGARASVVPLKTPRHHHSFDSTTRNPPHTFARKRCARGVGADVFVDHLWQWFVMRHRFFLAVAVIVARLLECFANDENRCRCSKKACDVLITGGASGGGRQACDGCRSGQNQGDEFA